MHKLFQGLFTALHGRRALLFSIVILLAALCSWRASKLSLNESVLDMLPSGEGSVDDFHTIVSRFGYQNRLFFDIGIETASKDDQGDIAAAADEFNAKLQASVFFKQIRYQVKPEEGMAALELMEAHMPALFGPGEQEKVLPLLAKDKVEARLASLKKMLLEMPMTGPLSGMLREDPLSMQSVFLSKLADFQGGGSIKDGRICSQDGKHLMLIAVPKDVYAQGRKGVDLINFIETTLRTVAASHPGVVIRYIGGPRIAVENQEMMKRDITVTMAASTFLILLLTFLVYRRWSLMLRDLLPVVFGGLLASGSFAMFSDKMSAIVAGFGGALIGIAVDYAVYLMYRYDNYEKLSAGPEDLSRHLSVITAPVVMGAATTMAAFLCLLLSPIPGQRQLGVFAAVGIGGAAFFSLVILPHMFSLRPSKRKKALLPLVNLWGKFFEWHRSHTKFCLGFIFSVSVVCAFGVHKVVFDGDIRKLSGMRLDTAEDERSISERWGGQFFKNTLIAVGGATMEEAQRKNDRLYSLLSELERSKSIEKFTSISPLAPDAATQQENIRRWGAYWNSGRAALAKERLEEAGRKEGFSSSAFSPFYRKLAQKGTSFPLEELRGVALGEAVSGFI